MAVKKTDPEDMVPVPAEQVEAREPKEKRTTTKKSDGRPPDVVFTSGRASGG